MIPWIYEKRSDYPGVDIACAAAPPAVNFGVLENVPCGPARNISVFITIPASGVDAIYVRMYAANRTMYVDTALAAATAAGTYAYTFTGTIGQSFDVRVTGPAAGAPAGSYVKTYAIARQ